MPQDGPGPTLFDRTRAGKKGQPLEERQASPKRREPDLAKKQQAKQEAWARLGDALTTTHDLHLGDAREMPALLKAEPGCVHLVVTSPPYWNLKRYADDRAGAQLGHIDERTRFLDELNTIWGHCLRLLAPGGRMCVVVGDVCRSRRKHGRHVVEPLHAYLELECQRIGFDPLAPIIWKKIANAARESNGSGAGFFGKPYEPNAIIKNDIEFILLFRKPGGYRHPTQEQRDLSLIDKADYATWFQQVWENVPGEPQRGHPAPFPKEIARRLIGMFSFVGDVVLDPFCGLGTTTLAAMEMHRSSIGVEVEPRYLNQAAKRCRSLLSHARVRVHGG